MTFKKLLKNCSILQARIIWFDDLRNNWRFTPSETIKGLRKIAKHVVSRIRSCFIRDDILYTHVVIKGQIHTIVVVDDDQTLEEKESWDYYGGPLSSLDKNIIYVHCLGVQKSRASKYYYEYYGFEEDSWRDADWIGTPLQYNYTMKQSLNSY
jgi:hypothetical protein